MKTPTVYKIMTDRLVIRCWNPTDAFMLQAAVLESLEHLKTWMPWAHQEPMDVNDRIELLRTFRGQFDLGQDYVYGIFDAAEKMVLGGTGLHTRRGSKIREIGYWIRADQTGKGLASESTSALVKVAFEILKIQRLEIRCDPANQASIAIPRKLKFTPEGVLREQFEFLGEPRDTQVWSLLPQEYDNSPAKLVPVRAYNVVGEELQLK